MKKAVILFSGGMDSSALLGVAKNRGVTTHKIITLSQRGKVPETEVFVKILKKNKQSSSWDRDVMVLLHGGPGGNHTLYADIENSLFEIADLVLIDMRGCGLSRKIEPQYCTLENHIDDLALIIHTLCIEKPIIHGCSYGAIVALGFSIKYPAVPVKVILSSCAASGSFIDKAKASLKHIGTPQQIHAAEKLWTGSFMNQEQFLEYYSLLSPLYFFKNEKMTTPPASVEKIPYNIELVNLAFTTFLCTFNFTDKLSAVKAKVLIFSGKNDWLFDVEEAETLHHGIEKSVLIRLDQCGHFPWKDQRSIFLDQVKSFVDAKLTDPTPLNTCSG